MDFLDALQVALKALRVNIFRSILTTLGIIIGVGAVIIMVSIGTGAEAKVQALINSLGSNLLIVLPGTTTAGGVRLGGGSDPTITEDDGRAIAQEIPGVQLSAPLVRGGAQVVAKNLNWSTVVYGITPDYLIAREWAVASGQPLTDEDHQGAKKVALLGQTVVNNLFAGQNPVGQAIRIQRVPFVVAGVLKSKGQSPRGHDQDDVIFVPLSTAKKRVLGKSRLSGDLVDILFVKAYEGESMVAIEAQVTNLLRQRHNIRPGQDDDFRVRNLAQFLEARAESSRTMSLLLAAVASISLIVGGIGIMNIMMVSVTERTREIGLRMAIGARNRDVLVQFLIEAITLSLIGGLIGVCLGLAGSLAIARVAGWSIMIDLKSILLSFGFAAAVGVFFGFYPAFKASRLNPIEALRYE